MGKMLKCGHDTRALFVTATISRWNACDNSQIEESVDHEVIVGWHLCPICKKPDGEPWIEDYTFDK